MNSMNIAAVNQIYRRPSLSPLIPQGTLCLKPVSLLCSSLPPPRTGRFRSSSFSLRASRDEMPQKEPDLSVNERNGESSGSISGSLKAILATAVAAGAMFCALFWVSSKPISAAPDLLAPQTVEQEEKEAALIEETEKALDEQFRSDQCDAEELKLLMEIKVKNKKIPEAIEIINKLAQVEPEEDEWPLLKSHLHVYNGDYETAKNGFSELVKMDPFRVEAYHGLVTVASQVESMEDLEAVVKKIEDVINLCRKENKKNEVRDFKLLLAQINVLESRYDDALKAYEDLVKEEPRDFRPYLCQGIIYTMLRKSKEAEKSFDKYRRLVPKSHPYASYFDDNVMATKLFAQKLENEGAVAKR